MRLMALTWSNLHRLCDGGLLLNRFCCESNSSFIYGRHFILTAFFYLLEFTRPGNASFSFSAISRSTVSVVSQPMQASVTEIPYCN